MQPRTLLILLTCLLTGLGLVARAGEPGWSLQGQAVTADNCNVGCPCIFGAAPGHGHCSFVGIFQVTRGHAGPVDLTGTRFAIAADFVREKNASPQDYRYVAFYLDSGASEAQKAALRRILTGPAFAGMGTPAEIREVPIRMQGLKDFGRVGKTYGGHVGNIAAVWVTPIAGHQPGQPLVVQNSAEPMFHWTCLGQASDSYYRSGGKDFRFEGTSGESHRFALEGKQD